MGTVKEHQTTIDGITYRTKTLPAAEGLDLLPRLVSMLGEKAMSLLMGVADGQVEALLSDGEVVAALVVGAAQNAAASADGLSGLAKSLLKYTAADKVRIGDAEVPGSVLDNFDTHFAGRYKHLLDVCAWAARAGFAAP